VAARSAAGYLGGLAGRPVAAEAGVEELFARLGGALPAGAQDPVAVIAALAEHATAGTVASAGPRFFGYVVGGAHPVSVAADWLVAAWDQVPAVYDVAPAAAVIEDITLGWVIDLLGLAGYARSGGFTTGSTTAHLTALGAARHHLLARRSWDVEAHGLRHAPALPVFAGRDAHVSISAAVQYLGLGRDSIHRVATDHDGRMRVDALAAALAACDGPAIVCAQAGEINTGAVDPLREIGELTRARGDWLHVDGAFGLWAAAAPRLRHLVDGVELADSWATDAHKMLNVPYDSGIVLCAHPAAHYAAMSTHGPYTTVGASHTGPRDNLDWTPEMSRRARAVPTYALLRTLGRDGIATMIERTHALAVQMATALDTDPAVTIANTVVFNQVLIDCAPPHCRTRADAHRFVHAVIDTVRAEGTCWLGGTLWQGWPMLRVSVANWSTTGDDIDRSAAAILAAIHHPDRCTTHQPDPRRAPAPPQPTPAAAAVTEGRP